MEDREQKAKERISDNGKIHTAQSNTYISMEKVNYYFIIKDNFYQLLVIDPPPHFLFCWQQLEELIVYFRGWAEICIMYPQVQQPWQNSKLSAGCSAITLTTTKPTAAPVGVIWLQTEMRGLRRRRHREKFKSSLLLIRYTCRVQVVGHLTGEETHKAYVFDMCDMYLLSGWCALLTEWTGNE